MSEKRSVKSEKLRYAAVGGMILIVPCSGTPQFFTLHFSFFSYPKYFSRKGTRST